MFLTPELRTSSWCRSKCQVLFAYLRIICSLNPLFETPSTTSGVFCDFHKGPAQICSRKGRHLPASVLGADSPFLLCWDMRRKNQILPGPKPNWSAKHCTHGIQTDFLLRSCCRGTLSTDDNRFNYSRSRNCGFLSGPKTLTLVAYPKLYYLCYVYYYRACPCPNSNAYAILHLSIRLLIT